MDNRLKWMRRAAAELHGKTGTKASLRDLCRGWSLKVYREPEDDGCMPLYYPAEHGRDDDELIGAIYGTEQDAQVVMDDYLLEAEEE